ncbi:transcriptional regulator with XRE-family HTH domain [Catenulispora sp. GAS73]|uniref:helix-turn-helix domain-containing protein n=1 Tax=Catenulispora sp. GAS73 TaxID=3156269 RepID=UPI003518CEAB
MVDIGTLIRERRSALGWSQRGLAVELCKFRPTLTRDEIKSWESGKHIPGEEWRGHLATVLSVPLSDLDAAATVSRMNRRAFLAISGLAVANTTLVTDLTASTASGDYVPMRDYLTPYAVDHAMARIVRGDRGAIRRLTGWMQDGETVKLRVNAGSILWKTGNTDLVEAAPHQLMHDVPARDWYLKSYARRVLKLPWVDAGNYTGRNMSAHDLRVHVRELSDQLDPGSRWCAAVFLGQAVRSGNPHARAALLDALRVEPVKENVRLIGLSLVGEQPWKDAA